MFSLSAARPVQAAINLDLSYVNQQSAQFVRFKGFVDAAVAGNPGWAFSATDAAYMYKLTGQAQYGQLAVQMVDSQVNTANAAIAAGAAPSIANDSYLYVGGDLADLALTYDWCGPLVTTAQRTRWATYADQAVFNVWNPSQAKWGSRAFPWSGWSTNNPGNNYYYSFVEATMYWALASNNAALKTYLQNDRLPLLQNYFAALPGGGSLEGTGYGVSHRNLFALYGVWRDATGSDLANANSHLTDSIAYWIHATVPTRDRVAAIGDQARVSEPTIYDYHRTLMLEARRLTGSAAAASNASWWLNNISIQQMTNGFNTRDDLLPAGSGGTPPAALTYYAPGVGQLFSRTGWDTGAMWLDFTAGLYDESHAHQDQGAFTLFAGDWLAVTENIWSHSGIEQGTETNNVVRFERNGAIVRQKASTTSTMTVTGTGPAGEVHATADLTPAYNGDPGVQSWQRSVDFVNRTLTVHDTFALGAGTQAIFQVNVPVRPTISGNTATAGHLKVTVLQPSNASLSVVDWTTVDSDYPSGYRIEVRGSSNQYVVQLSSDLPGSNPGTGTCTHANPAVSVSGPTQGGGAGSTLGYTLTVGNTDSAGCTASTFNLGKNLPAGWSGNFSVPNLSVNPGATASATLAVTTPGNATAGTYSIGVNATNVDSSSYSSSASATYTVAASATCTRANPAVSLSGPTQAVGAGSALSYTLTLGNTDSAGCAASTFNLGKNLPAGWSGNFSAASLSVNPGATASTTLAVSSPSSAVAGTYSIGGGATNAGSSSYGGNASATYTVAAPATSALAETVTTAKTTYRRGETVAITAKVSNGSSAVVKANVAFRVTKPNGTVVTRNIAANTRGIAVYSLQLSKSKDPVGTYQVRADAVSGTQSTSASTTFMVR